MCKECVENSETGYGDLDLILAVLRHHRQEEQVAKFPNWDHSEGVYRPNISEQLDKAAEDRLLFTEPTDLYEEEE